MLHVLYYNTAELIDAHVCTLLHLSKLRHSCDVTTLLENMYKVILIHRTGALNANVYAMSRPPIAKEGYEEPANRGCAPVRQKTGLKVVR